MAEMWSGDSPSARTRLKVSRQEMPASTRMRVVLLATTAQLPRLPLASKVTETPIWGAAYIEWLWIGSIFWVSRDLWGWQPAAIRKTSELENLSPRRHGGRQK